MEEPQKGGDWGSLVDLPCSPLLGTPGKGWQGHGQEVCTRAAHCICEVWCGF